VTESPCPQAIRLLRETKILLEGLGYTEHYTRPGDEKAGAAAAQLNTLLRASLLDDSPESAADVRLGQARRSKAYPSMNEGLVLDYVPRFGWFVQWPKGNELGAGGWYSTAKGVRDIWPEVVAYERLCGVDPHVVGGAIELGRAALDQVRTVPRPVARLDASLDPTTTIDPLELLDGGAGNVLLEVRLAKPTNANAADHDEVRAELRRRYAHELENMTARDLIWQAMYLQHLHDRSPRGPGWRLPILDAALRQRGLPWPRS